jgi:hypothetical protein
MMVRFERSIVKIRKAFWAKLLLALLTLVELVTLYQILFDIWMTAYPPAAPNLTFWRHLLVIRLSTAVVTGLLWIATAAWLFRHRRRDATA